MKKVAVLLPVAVLFLFTGFLSAEVPDDKESGCPANQAAQQGFDLLRELHQVMGPAWHNAYPKKDYVALGDAIMQFDGMLPKVKELEHTFKTVERRENFDNARSQFVDLVEKGKKATADEDYETLYGIYPDLHTGFEEMASHLLPLDFPEFASLQIVVDLMVDTHLKNNDIKAIVTSLEALKIKNNALQKAVLPDDLKSVEEKVKGDISAIDGACLELEKACGATNVQPSIDSLNRLKKLCDKFEQNYI